MKAIVMLRLHMANTVASFKGLQMLFLQLKETVDMSLSDAFRIELQRQNLAADLVQAIQGIDFTWELLCQKFLSVVVVQG